MLSFLYYKSNFERQLYRWVSYIIQATLKRGEVDVLFRIVHCQIYKFVCLVKFYFTQTFIYLFKIFSGMKILTEISLKKNYFDSDF